MLDASFIWQIRSVEFASLARLSQISDLITRVIRMFMNAYGVLPTVPDRSKADKTH